jgi:acetyltransferase
LHADYLVTSGNELGLTTADYIAYFAQQSQIRVIVVYIEHIADAERLRHAARLAAEAGKLVVAFKLGHSDAGRKAALAHTGALAGTVQGFDAVFGTRGIVRVDTLDELIEIAELVTRSGIPRGCRLGAITLSGAFRGILLDTAERAGVEFPPLSAATEEKLKTILSTGSYVGNPIDGGFSLVSDPNVLTKCLDALNEDPNIDFLLVQGSLPREPGSARMEKYIALCSAFAESGDKKPVAFTSFASYGLTDYSLQIREKAPKVSFLQEAYKTLRAVGRVGQAIESQAMRAQAEQRLAAEKSSAARALRAARASELLANASGRVVNEAEAKAILASYGIRSPDERVVANLDEALKVARDIGYPVVLKLVSSEVLHKSDMGGVHLDLRTPEKLQSAFESLRENVARNGIREEGYLVAQYVDGGAEMALGIHNDPEVGPLVMVGAGGIFLELIKDVEFRAPPVDIDIARDMVSRLSMRKLLAGYRGKPALDIEALCLAVTQLASFAEDCGDLIDSVDVNPLIVQVNGCLALDAAIVLKS